VNNKKAFITGISGFVGSFLAEYLLEKGYTVAGLIRPGALEGENIEHIRKKLELYEADLLEPSSIKSTILNSQPTHIFHLAALSSPAESYDKPAETLNNNISAQINVLEAIRENQLFDTKILVVSSGETYGRVKKENLPITENTPLQPMSPYGVSKVTQDFLGFQYALSYKMNIIRVRPFNHIGPRQSPQFVVSSFAKQIAEIEKNKDIHEMKVGNLKTKRDFVDVRDVVKAYELLLEKGKIGDVYNIASGHTYIISDILKKLISFSQAKITVHEDEELLRPVDISEVAVDIGKIKKDIDWSPTIDIETSLQDVLNYWRERV
jgi:GDP-4-dehydro-6-deoxy-D-mannose reductase